MIHLMDILKNTSLALPTGVLALYFSLQKIGTNISFMYNIEIKEGETNKISDITLINKKDKTEVIQEIFLVINNVYFTILKKETPYILPSNGSINIKMDEIVTYCMDNKRFEVGSLEADEKNGFGIYIRLNKKIYRTYSEYKNNTSKFFEKRGIRKGSSFLMKYSNKIIPRDTLYIVNYSINGEDKTDFVVKKDNNGFITWDLDFKLIENIENYNEASIGYILNRNKKYSAVVIKDVSNMRDIKSIANNNCKDNNFFL